MKTSDICLYERSPSDLSVTGDKDLSMSRDQKVMTLLPAMEKCPKDFFQVIFLRPKFDNSSPTVTRDKEISQSHMISDNDVTTS